MAFQETQKYRQHFPNCQEKVSSKVHYQSNLVHATNCDQHQWPALDDQRYARWLESALIWSTGPSLSKYTHVIYIYTRIVSLCITPCHSYPLPSISNLHWYLYVQYYVYWSSELRILILIPRLSMFAYFTSNYCSVLDSLRMQLNVDMDMSDKVGSCRWLAISCIILYHLISSYIILYHLIPSCINWYTVSIDPSLSACGCLGLVRWACCKHRPSPWTWQGNLDALRTLRLAKRKSTEPHLQVESRARWGKVFPWFEQFMSLSILTGAILFLLILVVHKLIFVDDNMCDIESHDFWVCRHLRLEPLDNCLIYLCGSVWVDVLLHLQRRQECQRP